jgi:hypothetical protein
LDLLVDDGLQQFPQDVGGFFVQLESGVRNSQGPIL